ncbi:MAG: (p)ppGpp synthase/HD superfamily hydrolase [bacterium]|jgi:(p)ppGpp synthase/HD superfamily hydrolase
MILNYPKIFRAIEFASTHHHGQFRKGTKTPYISHSFSVASVLMKHRCPEDLVIAGILHDLVEDTHITIEDVQQEFGTSVAQLVEGASEPDKSASWEDRKKHTLGFLKTASLDLLIVSCADKFHNIYSIYDELGRVGDEVWNKFNAPKERQAWYYKGLAQVFLNRIEDDVSRSLFREFSFVVDDVFKAVG